MDDEKLIELVREKTVLYDLSHPKYMDPKFKMAIWQSIGAEMNSTGNQCKNRWTNIRDHFRRYMQKRKTRCGQAAEKNTKKYKYEDQLKFLLPYSNDRDTLTNVPVRETSALTKQIETIEETPSEEHNDAETDQPQISSAIGRIFRGRSRVERSQNTATYPDTPSALLMKYILEKNDPEKITQVPPHDIDTFLAGIASTMKKLNPQNQHIAKGRIFNVVHELEFQELFNQPPHVSHVSSQYSQNRFNTNLTPINIASMNNSPDRDSLRSSCHSD